MKIISGRRDSDKVNELQDIPHAVMFLSLDISSEDEVEKVGFQSVNIGFKCFQAENYNMCAVNPAVFSFLLLIHTVTIWNVERTHWYLPGRM